MCISQFDGINGKCQAGLFRLVKGKGDSQIIRLHTEQPAYQRAVCTVAGAGFGKRTVQIDVRLDGSAA